MDIKHEYPPNIEEIRETLKPDNDAVFTYGNVIYNPSGAVIGKHLLVHETIHSKQQGEDPAKWWECYLKDPQFRLEQEVEAYVSQYKFVRLTASSKYAESFLEEIVEYLSGKMYGNIITAPKAKTLIRHRAR